MAYNIDWLLLRLEEFGLYDFILPFLLVFALSYAILSATSAFGGKKNVNLIIALVIGLFAIRLPFARDFMQEAFSRLGVALAALIVIWILAAFFINSESAKPWFKITFGIIGAIATIIVLFNSFDRLGWLNFSYVFIEEWIALIIGIVIIGGVIWLVSRGGDSTPSKT